MCLSVAPVAGPAVMMMALLGQPSMPCEEPRSLVTMQRHPRCVLPPALLPLLLLALAPPGALGARLLAVPLASESHIAAFIALTTELETRGGHEIVMVASDSMLEAAQAMAAARNPRQQHKFLTYPFRVELFSSDMADIANKGFIAAIRTGFKILAAMTELVIGDRALLRELAALQPALVIGDSSASYGHWLTALLGLPSVEFDVGTSSAMLHAGMFGGQQNPAYVPAPGTFFPSTGMTFRQRCVNLATAAVVKLMLVWHGDNGPIRELAERHGIKHLPGRGPGKPLLLLVNFDWALEPARPVAPSTIFLGALMPRPPQPLPADITAWLQGKAAATPNTGGDSPAQPKDDGSSAPSSPLLPVVFVSFGASFLAPDALMPALAAALVSARCCMRFLLRLREGEAQSLAAALQQLGAPPLQPHELLVRPRFPQNDLLALRAPSGATMAAAGDEPAIAAFVTQGGYLSMQEAGYHGVPVIGIPLTLGQGELVQHAADHGRGLLVPKEGLMSGDGRQLADALLEVVSNSSYKRQAAVTAARIKAHPQPPGQRAADAVGYALAIAATGQGSFLHTHGQDMPWHQVHSVDVLAAFGLALVCVAAAAAWVCHRLLACMLRPTAGSSSSRGAVKGAKGKHE